MSFSASSLASSIPSVILATVLGRLALPFLASACGDVAVAREAARAMLVAYDVQSEAELALAADVISFGLHSLDALSQAMAEDLPLNRVIQLRGSAVSLNRAAHRSRQALAQMQRDRRAALPQPQAEPPVPAPSPAPAPRTDDRAEAARQGVRTGGDRKQGKYGGQTCAQMLQKRMTTKRIVETSKRTAAQHLARMQQSNHNGTADRPAAAPGVVSPSAAVLLAEA